MNAKQRALNIWESYYKNIPNMSVKDATQCAIIHVKGIIEEVEKLIEECRLLGMWSYCDYRAHLDKIHYWRDVLTELNQM